MDIGKLTERYRQEDPMWSVENLLRWLREKKQIPEDVAEHALKLACLELEKGMDISTHHTDRGFDNYVLNIAREFITEQERMKLERMELELERKIKSIQGGNRFVRAFRVLTGKA